MARPAGSKSSPVKLFHGINSAHEFWQSEDNKLVILRVHGEPAWSSHRKTRFVAFHDSAEEAAARLGAVLDATREYREINDKFHLLFALQIA
jgi:hypothetical protein